MSCTLEIFQARAHALVAALTTTPSPRSLMADAKLYHEDHTTPLRHRGVITRLPNTMGPVAEAITPALALARGHRLDDTTG